MKYSLFILIVLILFACENIEESLYKKIRKELENEAIEENKRLRIDSMKILTYKLVSGHELRKEMLNILRDFKKINKNIKTLATQKKESHEKKLNEINHKYPHPNDVERLTFLLKEINTCDSLINESSLRIDSVTIDINSIIEGVYNDEDQDFKYYEIMCYLRGQVNEKPLDDTAKVFVHKNYKFMFKSTNVLYVPK